MGALRVDGGLGETVAEALCMIMEVFWPPLAVCSGLETDTGKVRAEPSAISFDFVFAER